MRTRTRRQSKALTAGDALSLKERRSGRSVNDHSSRLRGVSARIASPSGTLLRRSYPQRTPGFSTHPSSGTLRVCQSLSSDEKIQLQLMVNA